MYPSLIRAVEMARGEVIVASKTATRVHRLAVGTVGELLGSSLDDIHRIVDDSLQRPPTAVHPTPLPPLDGACELWASTAQLQRTPDELVEYLFHSNTFPEGAVLSTGTSLVPPIDQPTRAGDVVTISIDDVGELVNPVTAPDRVGPWLRERMTEPLAPPPEV